MRASVENLYDNGKSSLESLLREKAYSEVKQFLEDKSIDISKISDEDIENLVAAKAQDMMTSIKSFGVGAAFSIAITLVTGI